MKSPSAHNQRPTKTRHRRSGSVTVETALVVPIIFMIFLGAVELTAMNIIRHTASNAAYEAARKAALPGADVDKAEEIGLGVLTGMGFGNGATAQINLTTESAEAVITVPMAGNSWGLTRFSGGLTIVKSCKLTREQVL